jgi:hypothetical protein
VEEQPHMTEEEEELRHLHNIGKLDAAGLEDALAQFGFAGTNIE